MRVPRSAFEALNGEPRKGGNLARVVIPTSTPDFEAAIACAALRSCGHHCDILYADDYPKRSAQTVSFGERTDFMTRHSAGAPAEWQYDIGWLRDLHPSGIRHGPVHPEDEEYVRKTIQRYYYSLWPLLADGQLAGSPTFWINSLEAARRGESKLLQLHLARLHGLRVPHTIISNDPVEIYKFTHDCPDGVIRKSLIPYQWFENEVCFSNKTNDFTLDNLPSEAVLSLHPEIFQHKVSKRFEVRVVFMGKTYFALRLDPGLDRLNDTVDWRIYHYRQLAKQELIELPDSVFSSCRLLMNDMGLVSASFDFAIDDDGLFHFLELNQGGLFMWMEDAGVPVLQAFIEFLLSKDASFCWNGNLGLSVAEIIRSDTYLEIKEQQSSRLPSPHQADGSQSGN